MNNKDKREKFEYKKEQNGFLTLSSLLEKIKKICQESFKENKYWIIGEISDWKSVNGHYYGEIIEYNKNLPMSKARITLWKNLAKKILLKFEKETGQRVNLNTKVLMLVKIIFHNYYGFSLQIMDIEPKFTTGNRILKQNEIIEILTKQNLIHKNKNLTSPKEFTRIAVISSTKTAGLEDFLVEANLMIKHNLCQFDFYQSLMQGEKCSKEIVQCFKQIQKKDEFYDCIVILRGGGSKSDMDWFDDIEISSTICKTQTPVFIGIGHKRDVSILDQIANKTFDTPSKAINYIVNIVLFNAREALNNFSSICSYSSWQIKKFQKKLLETGESISKITNQDIIHQTSYIFKQKKTFIINTQNRLKYQDDFIKHYKQNILVFIKKEVNIAYVATFNIKEQHIKKFKENLKIQADLVKPTEYIFFDRIIKNSKKSIMNLYKGILSVSIHPTLQRGFCLTKYKENYVTSSQSAKKHDNILIIYSDGEVHTKVHHKT